jgi:aminoglycoside phosphotransferase (APT) family kinase protein
MSIAAALARHGIHEPAEPMASQGMINDVYAVGASLVLRVSRSEEYEEDARTEAVAAPAAFAAGIMTPELLIFDDSRQDLPFTFTVYRRAPGQDLASIDPDDSRLPHVYQMVGEQLKVVHHSVKSIPDPRNWLDIPELPTPAARLAQAQEAHRIDAMNARWLTKWINHLVKAPPHQGAPIFLHNDLHAGNTMVEPHSLNLTGLIDWGDAGWGDPAIDFQRFPAWALPWVLEGYGSHDPGLPGRALAGMIDEVLEATIDEWEPWPTPWTCPTAVRWINLMRLISERPAALKDWLP